MRFDFLILTIHELEDHVFEIHIGEKIFSFLETSSNETEMKNIVSFLHLKRFKKMLQHVNDKLENRTCITTFEQDKQLFVFVSDDKIELAIKTKSNQFWMKCITIESYYTFKEDIFEFFNIMDMAEFFLKIMQDGNYLQMIQNEANVFLKFNVVQDDIIGQWQFTEVTTVITVVEFMQHFIPFFHEKKKVEITEEKDIVVKPKKTVDPNVYNPRRQKYKNVYKPITFKTDL